MQTPFLIYTIYIPFLLNRITDLVSFILFCNTENNKNKNRIHSTLTNLVGGSFTLSLDSCYLPQDSWVNPLLCYPMSQCQPDHRTQGDYRNPTSPLVHIPAVTVQHGSLQTSPFMPLYGRYGDDDPETRRRENGPCDKEYHCAE